VLLKLPNRAGLRFQADGGAMTLEDSVYLGRRETLRRSRQIVLRAPLDAGGASGASFRWAFRRT
jgi:uncharacterized heparinase superfamily protein